MHRKDAEDRALVYDSLQVSKEFVLLVGCSGHTQGESLDTDALFHLISESRRMSRQLDDYRGQKGTAQTCAKRLAEFLEADFIKNEGLNCKLFSTARNIKDVTKDDNISFKNQQDIEGTLIGKKSVSRSPVVHSKPRKS